MGSPKTQAEASHRKDFSRVFCQSSKHPKGIQSAKVVERGLNRFWNWLANRIGDGPDSQKRDSRFVGDCGYGSALHIDCDSARLSEEGLLRFRID